MPQTLLLADDSLTIQRVIELTFADEDIDVVAVSDGDQAIAHIDSNPPDIVLVDAGMPGRTGYDVAEHIKQAPALEHIPVLLLTGAFEPVDHERAAEAGCDGILAKPFEPQQVIARVKELLARPAQEARPLRVTAAPEPPVIRPERTPASEVARLDSYFAQLDAAFATLSDNKPADPAPLAETPSSSMLSIDWFAPTATPVPPHESTVPAAPPPPDMSPAARVARQEPDSRGLMGFQVSPPASPPPPEPAPPALPPSLADAFAAILSAEQQEPMPPAPPSWPAPGPAQTATGALSEEAMEEITRRVAERLTDKVVREMVGELVSTLAERLVREEIERIKASIQ